MNASDLVEGRFDGANLGGAKLSYAALNGASFKGANLTGAEIKAALGKAPLTSGHPAEEALLLARVYQRIVGPKLSQLEQARVLADLKSRANASSLNPSATGAPSGVPANVRAKTGGTFGSALKWAATQTAGRG